MSPEPTTYNTWPTQSNVTPLSEDIARDYLDTLQEKTTLTMIPAIIFLIILAVVGMFGNSLILLVYWWKIKISPTNIFLTLIAVFDLLTNVLVIPGEVYRLLHYWQYDNAAWCKVYRYLSVFTNIASGISLTVVAGFRYHKICKPFKSQISIRQTRNVSFIIVVVAAVFSMPSAIVYGIERKETDQQGIYVYGCYTDHNYAATDWPLVNSAFLLLLFLFCFVPILVLYVLIGIRAWHFSRGQLNSSFAGSVCILASKKNATSVYNISRHSQISDFVSSTSEQDMIPAGQGTIANSNSAGRGKISNSSTTGQGMNSNSSTTGQGMNSNSSTSGQGTISNSSTSGQGTISNSNTSGQDMISNSSTSRQDMISNSSTSGQGTISNSVTSVQGTISNLSISGQCTISNSNTSGQCTIPNSNTSGQGTISNSSTSGEGTISNSSTSGEGTISNSGTSGQRINSNLNKSGQDAVFISSTSRRGTITNSSTSMGGTIYNSRCSERDKISDSITSGQGMNTISSTSWRGSISRLISRQGTLSKSNSLTASPYNQSAQPKSKRREKIFNQTTRSLVVVTIVFILTYLPYFTLTFLYQMSRRGFDNMSSTEAMIFHVFHRFLFLNSAANPIVYSLCSTNFRRSCLNLLKGKC